jgi:hypothetical protein
MNVCEPGWVAKTTEDQVTIVVNEVKVLQPKEKIFTEILFYFTFYCK